MEGLIYYSSLPGRLQYCLYINNACNFLLSTENIYIIYICIITITIHNLETGVLLIYTNRSYLTYFFFFPRCSASLLVHSFITVSFYTLQLLVLVSSWWVDLESARKIYIYMWWRSIADDQKTAMVIEGVVYWAIIFWCVNNNITDSYTCICYYHVWFIWYSW